MKIKAAYIPCAGKGTRIEPFSSYFPKEILPVGGIPLLGYALNECQEAGVREIGLILNSKKMLLYDFARAWAKRKQWKVKIEVIEQKKACGVGDALFLLKDRAPEAFYWLMPDNVFQGAPLLLLKRHFSLSEGCLGLLQHLKGKEKKLYGYSGRVRIKGRGNKVQVLRVERKQKGSFAQVKGLVIRGAGRGILTHEVFPCLLKTKTKSGEFDDAPAYDALARQGKLYGVFWKGKAFDCGRWIGFLEANNFFFQKA